MDPADRSFGLVAGWGSFPVQVAQSLRQRGHRVYCVAINQHASEDLHQVCDDVLWSGVGRLGKHLRYFRSHGVRHVTMAGKLFKSDLLFQGSLWLKHLPDLTCILTFAPSLLGRHRDARDDSLLLAVTHRYEKSGMEICAATDYAPELLVEPGVLAGVMPKTTTLGDVRFGWQVARRMGDMDIGQSITVKNRTIIAVEAIEGTDQCIQRTGDLCRAGGWTLVKVSKPEQDMRFDVPTIGPQTVSQVGAAGGKNIAIEAGKTIVLEREKTLRLARKMRISIVAFTEQQIAALESESCSDVRRKLA